MNNITTRFGQIRKGERFWFEGTEWKRTQGTFAKRVSDLGQPGYHWPFKVSTLVEKRG